MYTNAVRNGPAAAQLPLAARLNPEQGASQAEFFPIARPLYTYLTT
jgi:hypothetical protein